MTPLAMAIWTSIVLAGFVVLGGLIWSNRHCLKRTWAQRIGIGLITCAAAVTAVSQFARVSPDIVALPGNVQVWLDCLLLLGCAVMVWAKALERKR